VINDSGEPWSGTITFRGAGEGHELRPQTDATRTVNGTSVAVQLAAYEGILFEFAESHPNIRKRVSAVAMPKVTEARLPSVEPSIGRGEFVRETFVPDTLHSKPGLKSWSAQGRIIKSNVDVHLFGSFHYEVPANLSAADAVAFDTWVPPGQLTGSQLLVIVHERDGGDFYATANRLLSVSGPEQVIIPCAAFELAGWSTDPDGRMDWTKVSDIRIGWGGYFGTEGETVEFSFSEPKLIQRHQP
jgi:hypothetical protein